MVPVGSQTRHWALFATRGQFDKDVIRLAFNPLVPTLGGDLGVLGGTPNPRQGLLPAPFRDSLRGPEDHGVANWPMMTQREEIDHATIPNTVHFSILTVLGPVLRDDVLERSLVG